MRRSESPELSAEERRNKYAQCLPAKQQLGPLLLPEKSGATSSMLQYARNMQSMLLDLRSEVLPLQDDADVDAIQRWFHSIRSILGMAGKWLEAAIRHAHFHERQYATWTHIPSPLQEIIQKVHTEPPQKPRTFNWADAWLSWTCGICRNKDFVTRWASLYTASPSEARDHFFVLVHGISMRAGGNPDDFDNYFHPRLVPPAVVCDVLCIQITILASQLESQGLHQGDFHPASWFRTSTNVPPARLRKEKDRGNIRAQKRGARFYYSVEDARRLWPADMEVTSLRTKMRKA